MTAPEGNWPVGLKRTRQREQVWELLRQADAPLTAMEVYTRLAQAGNPLWMSTIYRILDHLVVHSLLTKTVAGESHTALYWLSQAGHVHYAVCLNCRRMIPLNTCALEVAPPGLEDEGFRVTGHRLELYGYCRSCKP
jgi:Fur family ferric uptake transcriptional regulator